jgi:tol-pal system protein YbgF
MRRVAERRAGAPVSGAAARRRAGALAGASLLVVAAGTLAGCYPPEMMTMRSGLDSLRAVVDTMSVRDSVAFQLLQDTRREVGEQRDILLSTRASSGTTTQEMFEQMGRLEAKLDEVMGRFQRVTQRNLANEPGGADAGQLYDQATQDLTQGRYDMALQGFRDFVRRFPTVELADNAQYGVGECFFAQSQFDSAAIEYAKVDSLYPQGDKVPAALYKMALSLERLGKTAEAKKTFGALIQRYPLSGEAQLAREQLGNAGH